MRSLCEIFMDCLPFLIYRNLSSVSNDLFSMGTLFRTSDTWCYSRNTVGCYLCQVEAIDHSVIPQVLHLIKQLFKDMFIIGVTFAWSTILSVTVCCSHETKLIPKCRWININLPNEVASLKELIKPIVPSFSHI